VKKEVNMSEFLSAWARALGFDGQSLESVISEASPEMRGYFRRSLGPNLCLDPGAVRGFLEGYIDCVEGGLALRYCDGSWRVERVEGLGGEPDHARSLQATIAPDATPAEMLASNIQQSLRRQAELLNLPIDPDDPKTMRLIADVANQTLNAGLRRARNRSRRQARRQPHAERAAARRRCQGGCALRGCFNEPPEPGSGLVMADCPIVKLTSKHVKMFRDRKAAVPEAGNTRLKALRGLFKWALAEDDLMCRFPITGNPARDVPSFRTHSAGHHTWTLDEVERFEAAHAPSSTARLGPDAEKFAAPVRSNRPSIW
jgi:hypothetical protein